MKSGIRECPQEPSNAAPYEASGEAVAWFITRWEEEALTRDPEWAKLMAKRGYTVTPLYALPKPKLKPAEANGWRDISTAPKDGTVVLLARFDAVDDDPEPSAAVAGHWAHWADHKGWYLRGFGALDEGGAYFSGTGELSDNGYRELQPTHWMPLPPTPESSGQTLADAPSNPHPTGDKEGR